MQTERLKIFFGLKLLEILKGIVIVITFGIAMVVSVLLTGVIIKSLQWLFEIPFIGTIMGWSFALFAMIVILGGMCSVLRNWMKGNWKKAGRMVKN